MDAIVPLLIILPVLGMGAGVTIAIVRVIGRQRQIELLQRERLAALERGADPGNLPTLRTLGLEDTDTSARLAQNLQVIGVILAALGIGLGIVFRLSEEDGRAWTLGIVPVAMGAGLWIASLRAARQPPRSGE